MAADVGFHRRVFEDPVAGRIERTVFQHEVLRIAQQLLAAQLAVHQPHVFRMPGQILAIQFGIIDRDVLALPEGVLGRDLRVADHHVLAVLEHVLGVAHQPVHLDVAGEHKGIGAAAQLHVLDLQAVHFPEGLVGVGDEHALEGDVLHLAEEFRSVDGAVAHHQVVGVPDGGAGARREIAVRDQAAVDVPPGILAVKLAAVGFDVAAMLDTRFAVDDGDVLQAGAVDLEQRPFAAEFLILNDFHMVFRFLSDCVPSSGFRAPGGDRRGRGHSVRCTSRSSSPSGPGAG